MALEVTCLLSQSPLVLLRQGSGNIDKIHGVEALDGADGSVARDIRDGHAHCVSLCLLYCLHIDCARSRFPVLNSSSCHPRVVSFHPRVLGHVLFSDSISPLAATSRIRQNHHPLVCDSAIPESTVTFVAASDYPHILNGVAEVPPSPTPSLPSLTDRR